MRFKRSWSSEEVAPFGEFRRLIMMTSLAGYTKKFPLSGRLAVHSRRFKTRSIICKTGQAWIGDMVATVLPLPLKNAGVKDALYMIVVHRRRAYRRIIPSALHDDVTCWIHQGIPIVRYAGS
ncbi:hypothetical protein MTO96_000014 [Rhipicephalus appendiculatus]